MYYWTPQGQGHLHRTITELIIILVLSAILILVVYRYIIIDCFFMAFLPYMAHSHNRDLVDEQDAKSIRDSMFGRQTRLLVTIGHGYHGLADRIVEPLMSPRDRQDNFVLLWAIGNNS